MVRTETALVIVSKAPLETARENKFTGITIANCVDSIMYFIPRERYTNRLTTLAASGCLIVILIRQQT